MAHPRIFISSTYYDLKHLRSSLENFIESLGFDPILSEKGDIAYSPDIPLDESCYREVRNADIFVIIIGGRYGSEKSEGKKDLPKHFYDRYDSITKQEYKSAADQDIPIYILIEKSVYSDFETYLRNKDNQTIVYAHVDSINIFHLIEEILAQPRNNPLQQFDRYSDIEIWLKEQWAGLFRELLNRSSSQRQLTSLASQIGELSEISKTLKNYLEEIVSRVAPDESAKLIQFESVRLKEASALVRKLPTDDTEIFLQLSEDDQLRVTKQYQRMHKAISQLTGRKEFRESLDYMERRLATGLLHENFAVLKEPHDILQSRVESLLSDFVRKEIRDEQFDNWKASLNIQSGRTKSMLTFRDKINLAIRFVEESGESTELLSLLNDLHKTLPVRNMFAHAEWDRLTIEQYIEAIEIYCKFIIAWDQFKKSFK